MKEKIEAEFEKLITQFEGFFAHFNANATTLAGMMSSKTDAESQERFKNAEFTAVEWEFLTKNNILENSLKRTCSKVLTLIDLNNSVGLEIKEELIKKAFAVPGFIEAYENYAQDEVFVVDEDGNLQEVKTGEFERFIDKTKEVTKAHYATMRENIKQELENFAK